MLRPRRIRARDQRGFTLVETLVAMVTGMAVSLALFTILEVSAHQTTRLSEVAQATQVSRTAMTHIVDELHSACISNGFAPVKTGSTPTKLIFVNGYFPEENAKKESEYSFIHKDVIEYSSAKGLLTDTAYKASGEESSGEYPWKETGKTLVVTNVSEVTSTPVFRYYEYASSSSTGTTEAASTLKEMSIGTEIKEASVAKKVAAVSVSFRTAPYKKEQKLGAAAEQNTALDSTTLTTFAFSAPNSETTIKAGPCE